MADWIPVSERLPNTGVHVLCFWRNELGKRRISRAMYAHKHEYSGDYDDTDGWDAEQLEACYDSPDGCKFFRKEGWYEESWLAEYFDAIPCEVTHWMPVPKPPED